MLMALPDRATSIHANRVRGLTKSAASVDGRNAFGSWKLNVERRRHHGVHEAHPEFHRRCAGLNFQRSTFNFQRPEAVAAGRWAAGLQGIRATPKTVSFPDGPHGCGYKRIGSFVLLLRRSTNPPATDANNAEEDGSGTTSTTPK